MAIASKSGFDVGIINDELRSGHTLSTSLQAFPTAAILFGKVLPTPTLTDQLATKLSNMQELDANAKTITIDLLRRTEPGVNVGRGAPMRAPRPVNTSVITEAGEVGTVYHYMFKDLTDADIEEGRGKFYRGGESYVDKVKRQMLEEYVRSVSAGVFATGPTGLPTNSQFGSLRSQISDALTALQRGIVGSTDESALGTIFGLNRLNGGPDVDMQSGYEWINGVLTVDHVDAMATRAQVKGATELVLPMSVTKFNRFKAAVRTQFARMDLEANREYNIFGKNHIMVGDVFVYPEVAIPDSATWTVLIDVPSVAVGSGIKNSSVNLIDDPAAVGNNILKGHFKHQVVVDRPWRCRLVEGLS